MFTSNKIILLEAGFETQIQKYVGPNVDGDPLWTARFNATQPEAVTQTHLDFLNAGTDIIVANTYQATVEGHKKYLNLSDVEAYELIKKTVNLCQAARDQYLEQKSTAREIKVAASCGPYGAFLHDGSEYSGAYAKTIDKETLMNFHRPRIEACIAAGADLLAIETIPCKIEAEVLVDIMKNEFVDTKFWLSFQCKDESALASGENFSEVVEFILNYLSKSKNNNLIAIGVNCVPPKNVTPLLKSVKLRKNCPFIVYPNKGETYDVSKGWHGEKDNFSLEKCVPEWIELGVKYIGGCCRTNATTVMELVKILENI